MHVCREELGDIYNDMAFVCGIVIEILFASYRKLALHALVVS